MDKKIGPEMSAQQDLFIKGSWTSGYGTEFQSTNPATKEIVWKGHAASESDVNRAVVAAKNAFNHWSELPVKERIYFLEKYKEQLNLCKGILIETISQETGKPLWDATSEYNALVGKIPLTIQAYQERCQNRILEIPTGASITRHRPYGIMAVLGPFNFPAHLPNGHIAPALLAGNTIVFKPSELTPKVGYLLARCFEKAHFPEGVLNLVQGKAQTGKYLSSHADINGLLFTGSASTGKALLQQYSQTPGKLLALEMGGNNPLIISKVEDTLAAAHAVIQSAFLTSGQRCTCARRLILIKGNEEVLEKTIELTKKLKIGSYTDQEEPFMGPLINERAAINLITAQASMIGEGAIPLLKATMNKENNCFVTPGILDVTFSKHRKDEEIFGPLLQIIRVENLEEAIREANHTHFGLCAGIFTKDHQEWDLFRKQVRAGVLNWNTQLTGASSSAPFGGLGDSGNLRPSGYYAVDYCVYPAASIENKEIKIPQNPLPGVFIE